MSKKTVFLALTVLMLLLAACGGANDAADDVEEAAADTTIVCGDVDPGDLPDLGGQEIRMAVENAYPPFNLLNDEGEGIGWDYDMGRALCDMLNS